MPSGTLIMPNNQRMIVGAAFGSNQGASALVMQGSRDGLRDPSTLGGGNTPTPGPDVFAPMPGGGIQVQPTLGNWFNVPDDQCVGQYEPGFQGSIGIYHVYWSLPDGSTIKLDDSEFQGTSNWSNIYSSTKTFTGCKIRYTQHTKAGLQAYGYVPQDSAPPSNQNEDQGGFDLGGILGGYTTAATTGGAAIIVVALVVAAIWFAPKDIFR